MARTVSIGNQDFASIREWGYFYIDKTLLIREWWENGDSVTLITRPRRFGKTLNMSMVEKFFSVKYHGRADLFEGLNIWQEEKYRELQGTYPVIFVSFANVKERNYESAVQRIGQILSDLYEDHRYLLEGGALSDREKRYFESVSMDMPEVVATMAIHRLSKFLSSYYGRKVIILLDEYDTPMQEAYVNGYWQEMVAFIRNMFHAAFKTNPYLERAIMTGITRISKESVFSDLNNLEVVSAVSEKYGDCFGFTEEEVFQSLNEFGLAGKKAEVKKWYDGFVFGNCRDIYNPWCILNYLDKRKAAVYWANTSSNNLVGKLIREGDKSIKQEFEMLLKGKPLITKIDEQLVFSQLDVNPAAVWSLLLASGYLKAARIGECFESEFGVMEQEYELEITNLEVKKMFCGMISGWFQEKRSDYNDFIQALLLGDVDAMEEYMNRVAFSMFSYFDTGKTPSKSEPERFYHGFVLGLMVDLAERYVLTSNRESGFGRYDVMLEPRNQKDDAIIMEFKVFQPRREKELKDTVTAALRQIEEKRYEAVLLEKGIPKERIRKYGFAFQGNTVQIGAAG